MCPFASSIGTVSVKVSDPCRRRTSVTGSSRARNSANSPIPPSWRNFSSTGWSPRRSRITSSSPGTMNDVWRARPMRSSKTNVASLVKICRSGQNLIRVPERFLATRPPLRVRPLPGLKDAAGPSAAKTPGVAAREADALARRGPLDVDVHARGERVDHGEPDPVQATGGDVRAAAELAARVQLRRHDLDAGEAGLGLLVGGDAATVVVHLRRPVRVQRHLDAVGRAGQGLVDAVVDDLPQAVHEPTGVGRPDVHAGTLADRLEPLEDEEVGGVVGVVDDGGAPAGR